MLLIRAGSGVSLRPVVAVAAAVFVLLLGAEVWTAGVDPSAPHLPHTVYTGDHHQLAGGFDHAHLNADSALPDPCGAAIAILPRTSTAGAALTLTAASFALCVGLVCASATGAVRGPPREVAVVMTGRRILTSLGNFRR